MTEDLDIFFADFGTTHTLASTSIECIVGETISARSEVDGSWVSAFDVTFKTADLTGIDHKEKVAFDGVSYSVDAVKKDSGITTLTLTSPARVGEMVDRV